MVILVFEIQLTIANICSDSFVCFTVFSNAITYAAFILFGSRVQNKIATKFLQKKYQHFLGPDSPK